MFELALLEFQGAGMTTWSLLSKWVMHNPVLEPYDHAVIDEAHDLGQMELAGLRAIVAPGRNDLYFCGDAGQQIYRVSFSWSSLGIDIRGRSSRLRVNYGTTSQIKSFAERVLPDGTADEGSDEGRDVISLMSGPEPEVHVCETAAEERERLGTILRDLVTEGVAPGEIAIFARTEHYLDKVARGAVSDQGLEYRNLSDESDAGLDGVLCGTMHRAKGLEFRIVVLVGCSDGLIPLKAALDAAGDDAERDELLHLEAHLLYVASSRARERLLILASGEPSLLLHTMASREPAVH